MDSLLGHRAARLFWVQYFGRHEATARWRELRDALCCEFGALSSGVLTELRSALDESKAGEVHLVDFALLTDSFGVAAAVVHAQRVARQSDHPAARSKAMHGRSSLRACFSRS